LKDAAAKSIDPCLTAKFIALSDQRVRALFLKKFQDGYVFRGIDCLDLLSIPENRYVLFDFDCKPGTLCLIKPAFLVVVNMIGGYVEAIVDPYIPTSFELLTRVGTFGRGDVSLDIDISTRWTGSEWCVKVKVKVNVEGIGSGTVSLPEVCLGADGVCSSVNSGGGDIRAEAEICWRGSEICANVTGKIKLFGRWYEHTEEKCVGI